MLTQTSQKRELFASTLKKVSLGVFAVILISVAWMSLRPVTTAAATSSFLNFQARLQTAAGAIVPDGNYFIEFNLYTASSGGTSVWTERYQGSSYSCPFGTATGATNTKVVVANGFVTVNLGSLCTFPTTINWDQQLWLTMNVGGSGGTASYDGEMSPRLQLTAIPYAFKAGQLAQANSGGTLFSSLSLQAPTVGNQSFVIQDQGAAGTYNLLTAPSGSDGYVKLQGSTPGTAQTGNLNISGTAIANVLQSGTGGITDGGALTFSGSTTTTFTTPVGSSIATKINVPLYDPGAFNQIIALGLPSSANTNARAITFLDARASAHQPTIAVLSPDETQIFGLSYDGSNTTAYVKSTNASIGLQASGRTILSATYTGTTSGNVTIGDPTNVQGSLVFANSTNNAGVIVTSGVTSTQYTIQLPTAIGSANQCLNIASVASTTETVGYTSCATIMGVLDGAAIPNATGASIVSNVLYMQSASGSFPGVVNTTSQSFNGVKTFNSGLTIGASAGNGLLTNNGATVNTVLAVNNLPTGGTIGTASTTVDVYTAASINQTSSGQTITIPSPTASSVFGRLLYVTNIGTASFTMLGATISPGTTATLVWANTTVGGVPTPAWTFAGSDKSPIVNQTTQQTGANFNIDGTGVIGTSLTTPLVQSSGNLSVQATGTNTLSLDTTGSGSINVGGTNATTVSIANNAIAHTVNIANGAAVQAVTIGSQTSTSSTIINGGTGSTAVLIQSGSGGTISVGSNSVANSIQIGAAGTNTSNTQSINIGNVGSGGTTNVLIGSSSAATAGTTTIQGASSILLGNGITPLITVGASSGGTINIGSVGSSTNTTTLHIADTTAAIQTVTIGSTNTTSATTIQGGATGNINLATGGTITLGTTTNGITFTPTTGITATGTAQHTKTIILPAEYAGAVLDASNDSSCSAANNGTMTSGFDLTNGVNYYKWASNASAQCYDVVVRVPIPADWVAWASTTPVAVNTYTTNTSTSLVNLEVRNSSGTLESSCNYVNITPGSTSTWSTTNSSNCVFASTTTGYSASGMMTLRLRLTGNASSDVRTGGITLTYKSSF